MVCRDVLDRLSPFLDDELDPVASREILQHLAAAGYPLVGGRLDYLQGRAVAALVYHRRQHIINVFVWPVADAREEIAPAVREQGFHVIRGTHARMAYWVVSDLNAEELSAFVRMLAASPEKF